MENQSSTLSDLDKGLESMLALALDKAIEAHLAGRASERDQLLARHPELAAALLAFAPTNSPGLPDTSPQNGPRPDDPACTQIGPYRIERALGSGSFGAVYLAFDPGLRRQVAIKTCTPAGSGKPAFSNDSNAKPEPPPGCTIPESSSSTTIAGKGRPITW